MREAKAEGPSPGVRSVEVPDDTFLRDESRIVSANDKSLSPKMERTNEKIRVDEERPASFASFIARQTILHHRVSSKFVLMLLSKRIRIGPRGRRKRDGRDGPSFAKSKHGVSCDSSK